MVSQHFSHSLKNNIVHSFDVLHEKHRLQRNDFHRYLPLRSHITREGKLIGLSAVESEFFHILKNTLPMNPPYSISKLYTVISHATKRNTLYIKDKWEREAGIRISEEIWGNIWFFQWLTSNSMAWRQHGWKNIIRYFKTPHQEKYNGTNMLCWRQCGLVVANHHIFWDCPRFKRLWKDIQSSLSAVFKTQVPS